MIREQLTPEEEFKNLQETSGIRDLISYYPEEYLSKLVENRDKLNKISKYFSYLKDNLTKATLAMTCNNEKCPYRVSCILLKNGLAPVGEKCPIEQKLIVELESSLVTELSIDKQNTIEMELLYDLIDAKLLDMRTSGMISSDSVIQTVIEHTQNGMKSYKDIAPEFKIKIQLKTLKSSIYEEFLATRRAKKKYGLGGNEQSVYQSIKNAINRDTTK